MEYFCNFTSRGRGGRTEKGWGGGEANNDRNDSEVMPIYSPIGNNTIMSPEVAGSDAEGSEGRSMVTTFSEYSFIAHTPVHATTLADRTT